MFYRVLERFRGTAGRETLGSAVAAAAAAAATPVRRDQTAAPTGQHQQQHDRHHIGDGAH